jgi:formate hydrogenlyase subunit 6/NADH:ubiquinone oxidoreductase subunit I
MKKTLTRKEFLGLSLAGMAALVAGPAVITINEMVKNSRKAAVVDRDACLVWDEDTECGGCADACGQEEKAIYWKPVTVEIGGQSVNLNRPYVDTGSCAGCGECADRCSAVGAGAIHLVDIN